MTNLLLAGRISSHVHTTDIIVFLLLASSHSELFEIVESNDFTGTLPTELGLVTSLQHLKLNYVDLNIGTTLPTELGKLGELQTLNLRWTNIAGTLPTEYGHMKSLVDLDISHNDDLIGTFPTEYGYLKNLSKFCAFFMIILLGLLCLLFAVLFSVGCHLRSIH